MPKTLPSTLAEPVIQPRASPAPGRLATRALCGVEAALLLVAAVFLALHFVHLKADFPNYSPWRDWAKYTDEGWYGDAAIRLYQLGHWNVHGDFNPAAALPVWPAIEIVLFRATGVSLIAARALTVAVFALVLVCCYALLRRWAGTEAARPGRPSLAPAMVVLLLAVSPFCFAFSRLAILEPLLVLLTLVAMLVASAAGAASLREPLILGQPAARRRAWGRTALWTGLLGLLFPLMVLTKTTAVFLFPTVLWMLWAACGYRMGAFLRVALAAGAVGGGLWGAYYGLLVRPRYLTDYRYLFSANAYTGFTWQTLGTVVSNTVCDGSWIGRTLFALALVAAIGSLLTLLARGLRGNPLPAAMLLWVLGYGAFLAYHANLQPRYYMVLAVPLTVLAVLVFEPVLVSAARTWQRGVRPPDGMRAGAFDVYLLRATAALAGAALLFAAVDGGRQTVGFVRHPEYTWVSAAAEVRQAIERQRAADPSHSALLLSISGSDLSLMTGLASICDDFGSMTLPDRIAAYRPGWFATWNEVEDDKMEALARMYRLQRVIAVAAFDDTDRNLLILYRLDPVALGGPAPVPGRRRAAVAPRPPRIRIGAQPSASHLEH
jgi:hypothetical protein